MKNRKKIYLSVILLIFLLSSCSMFYPIDNNETSSYTSINTTTNNISTRTTTVKTTTEEPIKFKVDDYVGNVFQIVSKGLDEKPIATGSGFVFNSNGYFITNAHVMEDAYLATAIFDIKNQTTKEFYTYLDIKQAYYIDTDKDFFIGRIENYSSIKNYYKNVELCTTHTVGEKCYSIGYPNSSVDLQINEGKVINDISGLYYKLFTGLKYVGFTSYIAPGSSGGILVNSKGAVIGLTTMGKTDANDKFEYGAAIDSTNFEEFTNKASTSELKSLCSFLHPGEEPFVSIYLFAIKNYGDSTFSEKHKNVKLSKGLNETFSYYEYVKETESKLDDGEDLLSTYKLTLTSNLGFIYQSDIYYADGTRKNSCIYGFYSTKNGIDDMLFEFEYKWSNGKYYTIKCDKINYSENVKLTLINAYVDKKSYGLNVTDSNIEFAKKNFNIMYEMFTLILENCDYNPII